LHSASSEHLTNALGALVHCEQKKILAGVWKQLRWSWGSGQGAEDSSRRKDQPCKKPGCSRTCWVDDVVRAADFAQRKRVVAG